MSDQTNAVLVSIGTLNHTSFHIVNANIPIYLLVILRLSQYFNVSFMPYCFDSHPSHISPPLISVQSSITFTNKRHS